MGAQVSFNISGHLLYTFIGPHRSELQEGHRPHVHPVAKDPADGWVGAGLQTPRDLAAGWGGRAGGHL